MLDGLLAVCTEILERRSRCLQVPMGGPETTQLEALQLSWEACLNLQLELHSKLGDSRTASEETLDSAAT